MEETKAERVHENFDTRKLYFTKTNPKRRRLLERKLCVVEACYATPKSMHSHLRKKHKLKIDSREYQMYLRKSVPVLKELEELGDMYDNMDDQPIHFEKSSSEERNILTDIKIEAKSVGIFDHDIYDSEEDEDFIVSDESEEEESDSDVDEPDSDTEVADVSECQSLLGSFAEWMEGCDGGERRCGSVEQNSRQVKTILKLVDPSKLDVKNLLDRSLLRSKWLIPFKVSERKPGTVRSYCNSLRLFMDFLISTKIRKDLKMEDLNSVQTQARVWSKTLNKSAKQREFEKIYEDFEYLTNPEDVKRFETSQPCREAVKILETFSLNNVRTVPKQNEYTLVRDFLLRQVSLDNGGRPGPLMDLTLDEFHKAKQETVETEGEETTCYVVNIFRHKTSDTHGPARIVFNQCLHNWFSIFVSNIRGKFYGLPKQGNSTIFVTHTGKAMASNACSGRLTSLWGKALPAKNGGKVKMNNTMIRKSITTHIRKHHNDMKHHVADKLLHKLSTSDKYYNVVRKGEQAVETSLFLSRVFKGNSSSTITKPPEEAPICINSTQWTKEETIQIKEHFGDLIHCSTDPTMEEVKIRLIEREELSRYVDDAKRVIDKIRYIRRTEDIDAHHLDDIAEETLSQKISRSGILLQVFYMRVFFPAHYPPLFGTMGGCYRDGQYTKFHKARSYNYWEEPKNRIKRRLVNNLLGVT